MNADIRAQQIAWYAEQAGDLGEYVAMELDGEKWDRGMTTLARHRIDCHYRDARQAGHFANLALDLEARIEGERQLAAWVADGVYEPDDSPYPLPPSPGGETV